MCSFKTHSRRIVYLILTRIISVKNVNSICRTICNRAAKRDIGVVNSSWFVIYTLSVRSGDFDSVVNRSGASTSLLINISENASIYSVSKR